MDDESTPQHTPTQENHGHRTNVLGVHVDAISLTRAVERIESWIEGRDSRYVCVSTVHQVMQAHRSPEVRQALREADMVTPDGMPLVWLSRLLGRGGDRPSPGAPPPRRIATDCSCAAVSSAR